MWKTGNALFPSTYIHEKTLSEAKRAKMIEGRTAEGIRIADHKSPPASVYVYVSYKYQDTSAFLSKVNLCDNPLAVKKSVFVYFVRTKFELLQH